MVIERNFLEVYTYDRWTAKKIPTFYEGEHFAPSRLEMVRAEPHADALRSQCTQCSVPH